eukprot:14138-Heterococcus_DN1.PRE.1
MATAYRDASSRHQSSHSESCKENARLHDVRRCVGSAAQLFERVVKQQTMFTSSIRATCQWRITKIRVARRVLPKSSPETSSLDAEGGVVSFGRWSELLFVSHLQ